MVDVSPQSVFVERLKSALTSSFETLLAEITQVFVESFPPGATHCKRCTDIRNRENHEGVWSDADGARPQMLTSVPEPPRETVKKDQQFPSDDDEDDEETNQASLRLLSDTEIQKVPELLLFAPVKEEEEDLLEDPSAEHLGASGDALTPTEREETTPSSGGALHLKNQCDDEEHLVVHQILTDSSSSEPDASPESRLASVLDCSVQLQRIKVLQKLVDGLPRFHACSYCSRLFTSRKKHRRHTRFHTGERPYGCTICSRSFVLRKTLRLHTDWHGRRPHGCSQCRMSFSSRKKLRLHWSVHDGESPFLCWRCGVSYKSLKRLSRHLSQQHLESRS